MPEGDALRRAADRLRPLVGQRVEASSPNPRGRVTGVADAVDGRVLEAVEAVGKHLLLRFAGGVVVRSHLRMRGRWHVGPAGAPRHGAPWLVLRAGAVEATQWNGPILTLDPAPVRCLGPNVLGPGLDPAAAAQRLQASGHRFLGEALLDQRLVAGVGNMWMAEALWQARLSPWSAPRDVPAEDLAAAVARVAAAMRAAVTGPRGPHAVYRRAGRPCGRCGATIASRGLGDLNRTAYWCPACQPGGPTGGG